MNFTITAVERDVGLSKDVLRVWERRYGFPTPARDANGDRIYSSEQVKRLRLIKRLMDQGHRPGRLLRAPVIELEQALLPPGAAGLGDREGETARLDLFIERLRRHDDAGLLHLMQQGLAAEGLLRFVQDTVAPMSTRVGLEWENGRLDVFEEHLFTELTTRTLRQAIAAVPAGSQRRVLLTTVPNEPHSLGLLMVEAALVLAGARCLSLGAQTPLQEISQAAAAYQVDVVALSFSSAFPRRQIPPLLNQLRGALAAGIELWIGGAGCARLGPLEGVRLLSGLQEAPAAVAGWHGRRKI